MDPIEAPLIEPASPVVAKIPQVRAPRPLVGESVRQASWLWLSHVAPVVLLLFWGFHAYWLIGSEMTSAERWQSLGEAAVLATIVAVAAGFAIQGQRTGVSLSDKKSGWLLFMSGIVMGLGILFALETIPDAAPEWIIDRWELLYESFCFGMMGAFYAILLLCSSPLRRHAGLETVMLLGFTVIGVGATFLFFYIMGRLRVHFPDGVGITLTLIFIFVGGSAITALVIRTTLVAYTGIRRLHHQWQRTFMFLIAVIGPVAGLWLNKSIPFPVDFQAPIIYFLSVLNGGLLMLPVVRSVFWHRIIWLAQCVMFPFSAYFLMVFLPWLPLSLFAMIAIGSGFLIVVPLVLGVVHGYRIADGFREEVRDGRRAGIALMGIAAILTLPAIGIWSMWQDRVTLDEALTYIYSPDYRKDTTFPGNLDRLNSSLQHLRNAKQGIFLPFITPLYNEIVFHGLVLPNAKIEALQTAFFGGTAAQQAGALWRTPSDSYQDEFLTVRPSNDVTLQKIEVTEHRDGPVSTSQLQLTLQSSPDQSQGEYIGTVHLPEGVYVTGFGLYIDNQLVPARIVEKKTAMWVYEKISEQRRDPGLLIYKSRMELELRVFPFSSNQTRRAQLELTHSNATPVSVTVDNQTVVLGANAASPDHLSITTCATTAGSIAIADGAKVNDVQLQRTPYLHLLIDCSKGSAYDTPSLIAAIDQARKAFPDARLAKVSSINYEVRDVVPNLVPVEQLNADDIRKALLPNRGGLLQDRFLKRGLLQATDLMQTGQDQALLRPQFAVISSQGKPGRQEDHLEDFLRLVPDARVIYAQAGPGSFVAEDMASRVSVPSNPVHVALWRLNNHYVVTPAESRMVASFTPDAGVGSPQIYQAAGAQFVAAATEINLPATSRFADGVRTWAAQDEASLDPALLSNGAAALIGMSKKTGVLIPDSSYIAVESLAQWRIMEEKEKQKLQNKQVFEFEEPVATPEPGTWLMLLLGIFALWLRRRYVTR